MASVDNSKMDSNHSEPLVAETATHKFDPASTTVRPRLIDWQCVALVLVIKLLVLTFGVLSYQLQSNSPAVGVRDWLNVWNRWDAVHYQTIALQGYLATSDGRLFLPFFPLYPWMIRLFDVLISDRMISAFLVSTIASVVAALLLQRLVSSDEPVTIAHRAVLFLFIFPTSYFLHIGYPESLFLAFTLGCFLAAFNDRWALAALLGALACLTRINGALLIPALLVEVIFRYRATKRWRSEWLWTGAIANRCSGLPVFESACHRQSFYISGDSTGALLPGARVALDRYRSDNRNSSRKIVVGKNAGRRADIRYSGISLHPARLCGCGC